MKIVLVINIFIFFNYNLITENVSEPINFWGILFFVQLESILWGLGTAIGELPPYFVARAAGNMIKRKNEINK